MLMHGSYLKPTGIWWVPWVFYNEFQSNPMESDGIHEILSIKSYETQWNLMGPMGF